MKRRLHFKVQSWLVSTLCILTIISCNENNVDTAPVLSVENPTLNVDCNGGPCEIRYTVSNPTAGATIDIATESAPDWLSEWDMSQPNVIAFTVAANKQSKARSHTFEISYSGASPVSVTIRQAGTESQPFTIEIDEVTSSSNKSTIIPEDKEMKYLVFYNTTSETAGMTDDELFDDSLLTYRSIAEQTGVSLSEILANYAEFGDQTFETQGLEPATEYVLFCYGIDPTSCEQLTDIVKATFTTKEAVSVKFIFDITENSQLADIRVEALGYDGWFFMNLIPEEQLGEQWQEDISILQQECMMVVLTQWYLGESMGMTPEQIQENYFHKGNGNQSFSVLPDTPYIAVACGVDDAGNVVTDISYTTWRSAPVSMSENRIRIDVENIRGYNARMSVQTENNDPYTLALLHSDEIADLSNEQIAEYVIANYGQIIRQGDYAEKFYGLTPTTDYSIVAFGFNTVLTTDVFRHDFSTIEPVTATCTLQLQAGDYYDVAEIAVLDPMYNSFLPFCNGFALFTATTSTNAPVVHYSIVTADAASTISDQEIYISTPITSVRSALMIDYDTSYIAIGFAEDEQGDYGPIFRSEPLMFEKAGISDPSGYLDFVAGIE
jgi:hypothetical protein